MLLPPVGKVTSRKNSVRPSHTKWLSVFLLAAKPPPNPPDSERTSVQTENMRFCAREHKELKLVFSSHHMAVGHPQSLGEVTSEVLAWSRKQRKVLKTLITASV